MMLLKAIGYSFLVADAMLGVAVIYHLAARWFRRINQPKKWERI